MSRHDLGEFYTPDWLADVVLERAGFDENTRMLDPSCSSGRLACSGGNWRSYQRRIASDSTKLYRQLIGPLPSTSGTRSHGSETRKLAS
ncbi:MAG: hypothetical protein QOF12_188 [Solirubrobacteraceae bacterium]|nr:hypothetical protein [Solirubrobacteraceae bacterium]